MTGIIEHDAHIVVNLDELVVENRLDKFQCLAGVVICIKRFYRRFSCSLGLPVLPLRVLLVDVSAVLQHHVEQIRCRVSTVYFSGKSAFNQKRQSAAVVNMGMTQNHALDF